MNQRITHNILYFGIFTAVFILISAVNFKPEVAIVNPPTSLKLDHKLKKAALEILETKCNICHRKKNPFMVFKEQNISKRAKKIYQMVFIERRMPKGNEIRLTAEEYTKLKKWLFTEIF